jgi:AraC family transcriptional regulator of adaptative response/methylated-DNA-[protein]-cysteine methyltransferase
MEAPLAANDDPIAGPDPEATWRAVAGRDPAFDGLFFYGVTSTGIYCRPSCPARRPARDRVRFFATADSAEEAGYRPCKRCRPRDGARTDGERAVAEAAAFIEAHADEPVTLARLAAEAGLSASHLQRTFTRALGRSPRQYQNALRVESLKRRLKQGEQVSAAAYEVGYGSSRGLYENATPELGMSPARYRSGGKGLEIRYTIADSPLGKTLVGTTERGVCCVLLGDTEGQVIDELAREFPSAGRVRDDAAAGEWAQAVVDHVAGRTPPPQVPLDLIGTDFQRRVWLALRRIPPGTTVSYAEMAARLGTPGAARAVASACASNHLAVMVPCHRVVRGGSGLGGYKWGVERKRRLLGREKGSE